MERSHRIHVWNIYLHLPYRFVFKSRYIYQSHGSYGDDAFGVQAMLTSATSEATGNSSIGLVRKDQIGLVNADKTRWN